ncbi:MAG: DUF1624 domain-containing protein [Sandaracinaceae bacterium]|nr:DUF1624 domain-containing protein [Sandaracinaceae bacterium]
MKRLGGLDLARGLACLGMIEAHAYDAYVDAPDRVTAAFALTRFIALLPLPLFLTLAGMGVALRVQRGLERGEAPHDVRRELVWRGFRVVLAGFALNVIYGLMDGARELGSYLRFDVLHVIGASSMLLGLVLPGRARPQRTALVVALLVLLPSPWLNGAAADLESPLRFALVPFVDVPPFTVMPVFPLAVWCALGAAITPVCVRWPGRVALVALGVAVVSSWGMQAWLSAAGVPLSRTHPAVWLNALDLGARALFVIGAALVAYPRVAATRFAVPVLLTLGTRSLRVYAFHLPFAYGALGKPVRALTDTSVAAATPWVLGLVALTYALVRASDWLRDRWRAWRYTPAVP